MFGAALFFNWPKLETISNQLAVEWINNAKMYYPRT